MSLIIVRGLPGSGKSTVAKSFGCPHFEADMFFMRGGEYLYDPAKIKDAHAWCFSMVQWNLERDGKQFDVVVSNTFTQAWEFAKYIKVANDLGIPVRVIRCTGAYGNVHSVPTEVLEKMKNRFESYEGEELV